jgi:hypothetical protein
MTSSFKALPWARRCIWAGFILSGLMLVPSLRMSDATPASWMMHLILFLFVVAPFIFLGGLLRLTLTAHRTILLSIPYLACHAILTGTYLFGDPNPQEFGYLGLFLLPLYESIVALPVGGVLVLVTEAFARRAARRA